MRARAFSSARLAFIATAVCLGLCACSSIASIGSSLALGAGVISKEEAASINRTAVAVEKTFEDITPEQEYYIGRSVGATILSGVKPLKVPAATKYLNLLGQTLAAFSDKPETFGGYHFLIMDTPEINAFAAPGGLVFVSRGMIKLCQDESELAAVLAHEIAHVQSEHGLKSIKAGRLTNALTTLGTEAARNLGPEELRQVTNAFGDSVGDITKTMVNSGYSRDTEFEADKGAVEILKRSGYSPAALGTMLKRMKARLVPGAKDFAKTHPDPEVRIERLAKMKEMAAVQAETSAAKARRTKALAGI